MYILYDILLHLSLLLLIPYFLFKMFFVGKYRKGILERFGFIDKEKIRRLSVRDAGNSRTAPFGFMRFLWERPRLSCLF